MANFLVVSIFSVFFGWVAVSDLRKGDWPSAAILFSVALLILADAVIRLAGGGA